MRFQAEAKPMREAIGFAQSVVRRSTAPIMECLYLVADGGSVAVYGSDHKTEVRATFPASVSTHGVAAVNARDLSATIKAASGFVSVESGLRIKGSDFSVELAEIDHPFPLMDTKEPVSEVEGCADAIAACAQFVDDTDTNPPWARGVTLLERKAASYNGVVFCLSEIGRGASGQIIPRASLPVIQKVLARGGRMFVGQRFWRVEAEGLSATGPLLQGNFPDALIPKYGVGGQLVFSASADDLKQAVDVASLGRASAVALSVKDTAIEVTSEWFDGATANTRMEVDATGVAAFMKIAAKNLSACLGFATGSQISAYATGEFVRLEGAPGTAFVVGPMRDPRTSLPGPEVAA